MDVWLRSFATQNKNPATLDDSLEVIPLVVYRYSSPLGLLRLVHSDQGFVRLLFADEDERLVPRKDQVGWVDGGVLPPPYGEELDGYFAGTPVALDWPCHLEGTAFQQRVWQAVRAIPYGECTTYKKLGEAVQSSGYRAVGQAVGQNPLPIIIPCHRVLGTGGLGGYSGGLTIKRLLLELENAMHFLSGNV